MDNINVQRVINAEGLYCPEPVMMLHSAVAELAAGDVLRITATDPSTTRDIPQFCRMLGHELLVEEESEGLYVFMIRKAS